MLSTTHQYPLPLRQHLSQICPRKQQFRCQWCRRLRSVLHSSVVSGDVCLHAHKSFSAVSPVVSLHIIDTVDEYQNPDPSFSYLTQTEFKALVLLARETIVHSPPTISNYTTPKAPCLPPRVYPDVTAPTFSETNTQFYIQISISHVMSSYVSYQFI